MNSAKIAKVDPRNPDEAVLREAAEIIRAGGLVVIPTETVYGIAANMNNKKAVERLSRIKERPAGKPFSLHVYKRESIDDFTAGVSLAASKLMDKFWPGPLTLVFKAKAGMGSSTIGIRFPDDEIAFKIIARSQVPVVCPSANIAGGSAPKTFADAIRDLESQIDFAVDAGPVRLGVESTVVDVSVDPARVLRAGALSPKAIEETIAKKNVLFVCTGNSCRSVMAEALLKKKLKEMGRTDVTVYSAGLLAGGMGASAETIEILRSEGINAAGHVSQHVTREMVDSSDLVLVMEKGHQERMLHMAPEAKNRIYLLKEFAHIEDGTFDIDDPIGKSMDFYARTLAMIRQAVERISALL